MIFICCHDDDSQTDVRNAYFVENVENAVHKHSEKTGYRSDDHSVGLSK